MTERSLQSALLAARAASAKSAHDILVLQVAGLTTITDHFVICSGPTDRAVASIVDEILKELRDVGVKPYRIEGMEDRRWVLIDFLDFVAHVFHQEERDFYELERLWRDATPIRFDEVDVAADLDPAG